VKMRLQARASAQSASDSSLSILPRASATTAPLIGSRNPSKASPPKPWDRCRWRSACLARRRALGSFGIGQPGPVGQDPQEGAVAQPSWPGTPAEPRAARTRRRLRPTGPGRQPHLGLAHITGQPRRLHHGDVPQGPAQPAPGGGPSRPALPAQPAIRKRGPGPVGLPGPPGVEGGHRPGHTRGQPGL